MSAAQERDQVGRIAANDVGAALLIAKDIDDPWYRCQALAFVAWHAADHKQFLRSLAESLKSAWAVKNPNRTVTVAAWPVAALARRHFADRDAGKRNDLELRKLIRRLLDVISLIRSHRNSGRQHFVVV